MATAQPPTGASVKYSLQCKILDEPAAPISRLRSVGGLVTLLPNPGDEPEGDWLDAVTFARAARTALAGRDPAACRSALTLYGGEYLPEDRYEEWAERRREELRGLQLTLLVHLAELSKAEGD